MIFLPSEPEGVAVRESVADVIAEQTMDSITTDTEKSLLPDKNRIPFHRHFAEPLATAAMIVLLITTGAITFRNLGRLWTDSLEIGRSYDVMNAVDAIEYSLTEWLKSHKAFLASGDQESLALFQLAQANFDMRLQRLIKISSEDEIFRGAIERCVVLIKRLNDEATSQIASTDNGENQASTRDAGRIATLRDEIASELATVRSLASASAALQQDNSVTTYRIARYTTLISTLAGLALVGGVMLAMYRRRVEAELESRLRQSTLDAVEKYVIVCDRKQTIVSANEAIVNLFGLQQESVVGEKLYEVADGQLNLKGLSELVDKVHSVASSSEEIEVKQRFGSIDQRTLILRARRFSADSHGVPLTLLVVSDITEQRALEARNKQLDKHIQWFLEQIHDYAIFMMDTGYRATTWNSGVLQVLGYDEQEFLGRDVRPLIFTPESHLAGTVQPEFDTAERDGSASDDRWMMRKDGTQFWASGITTSIRDANGELVGFSKVMRDMTLQKQNSDEMSRLAAELSEESRRKNEFLATLAHELRNPLSPIKTAVQLMGMMDLGKEVEDLRLTMARQVEQMVRLIEDLTDVSRIGRGKIELKRQIIDIKSLIDAAIESSQALIRDNHQEIEVSIDDPSTSVDVDPARITQVITNLLNNASKYSDVDCRIRLVIQREEDMIVIRVMDNGNGIAKDRIDDIFEMFSQTGDSVERGCAGLGIGLMLVRTLVELHDGTVTAHSDGIGEGSEFVVRLPAAIRTEQQPESRPTDSDQSILSFKILVVDDMRALAMILARLLTKLGQQVRVVDSGSAAIEALKTYPAEIIFSDISMPGMSGYELAKRLRRTPETEQIRLVAMTGYGQASDREKALIAGFDEHMVKPVDIHRLRSFLAELSRDCALDS